MGYRRITVADYDAMLLAFHENPGNYSRCSKASGVSWELCKRGWEIGWKIKSQGIDFPAIKEVMAQEARDAEDRRRSEQQRRLREQEEMRATARAEAIDSRAEFGKLLKNGGQLTMALTGIIGKVLPVAMEMALSLAQDKAALTALPPIKRFRFLADLTNVSRTLIAATREHQESIHSHFGEPDKILAIEISEDTKTPEQMVEAAKLALEEAMDYQRIFLGQDAATQDALALPPGNTNGQSH